MSTSKNRFTIWVDADACPGAIKEILFRTAKRLEIETVLVANGGMRIPTSSFVRLLTVPHGADEADHRIIESMKKGDLVVTGDIPLASRVVEKKGIAIGTRGELYDEASVHGRLATRNLMEHLRSAGMETGGPKPFDQKDIQSFANQLDKILTRMLRADTG